MRKGGMGQGNRVGPQDSERGLQGSAGLQTFQWCNGPEIILGGFIPPWRMWQWQQLYRPVATPFTLTQRTPHTAPQAVVSLINLAFRFNRTAAIQEWWVLQLHWKHMETDWLKADILVSNELNLSLVRHGAEKPWWPLLHLIRKEYNNCS